MVKYNMRTPELRAWTPVTVVSAVRTFKCLLYTSVK